MSEGDMSSPEQENQAGFQPISTPQEHIDRFRGPGSPTSQHEMPDIRMQLGASGEELDADQINLLLMREQMMFSGARKDIRIFSNLIKVIENPEAKSEQKENARERVREHWSTLMQSQLELTEGLIESYLFRMKSPYPYESRNEEYAFKAYADSIKAEKDEVEQTPLSDAFLDALEVDYRWGFANFQQLEGMGVVLPVYFDALLMGEWVKSGNRLDPRANDLYEIYSKDLNRFNNNAEALNLLPNDFKEGLRTKAVEFQDDSVYWRMAVSAASQMEYQTDGTRFSFMSNEALRDVHLAFIYEVFGDEDRVIYNGHEVPKKIRSYYSMKGPEEMDEDYILKMSATITHSVKRELDRLGNSNEDLEVAKRLAQEVKAASINRKGKSRDLIETLADVVVKSGIVVDQGFFTAGDMGWGWEYNSEIDSKTGQPERTRTGGDVFRNTDIKTTRYWRDKDASNKGSGFTDSGIMPPMSAEYIEDLNKHAPDWKPGNDRLEDELRLDPKLNRAWNRLFGEDGSWGKDENIKKRLKAMVWFWETPYEDNQTGRKIKIPFFMPPDVPSLNFLNAVSDQGDLEHSYDNMNDNGEVSRQDLGAKTLWEQLRDGRKMSEIEWKKLHPNAFTRWLVTVNQQVRWGTVLANPTGKGEYWQQFYTEPKNSKELHKRIDLGVRDEKEQQELLSLAIHPPLVILNTVSEWDIVGFRGDSGDVLGDWTADVSNWIVAVNQLPKEKGVVKNYRRIMKDMMRFYHTISGRLANVAGDIDLEDLIDENKSLRKLLEEDVGVKTQFEDPEMIRKRR